MRKLIPNYAQHFPSFSHLLVIVLFNIGCIFFIFNNLFWLAPMCLYKFRVLLFSDKPPQYKLSVTANVKTNEHTYICTIC